MANSPLERWVRYDDTDVLLTQKPVDAIIVRDSIVGNSSHLVDESTQVRVNFAAKDGSYLGTQSETGRVLLCTYGPFPIRCMPDGNSCQMRVRLHAALASASAAEDVYFILGAMSDSATGTSSGVNVASFEVGSTTPAWIDAHTDNLIYIPRDKMPSLLTTLQTPNAVSGADPLAVNVYLAYLHVVAADQGSSNLIRVSGVYAAEYIGL